MEGTEERSADLILSTCFSGTNDGFGDPRVLPRVGHQYQAEIPSLIVENDPIQHANRPIGAEFVGKGENLMTPNTMFANGQDMKNLEQLGEADGAAKMDVHFLAEELKTKMDQDAGIYYLPDSSSEAWTDAECDGFLLGLYIFGKNLIIVKRFIETKPMGDILRFYYGKFYGSSRYRRWSACRKFRGRCVSGKKLFTGWRHQELLSRLVSRISEDRQQLFIEVSRQMEEGRTSFEEYVFTVKGAVGLGNLVEAVGIGRGKRDLTRVIKEPNKKKSMLPPIPTGKSCSLLSPAEIIKLLTGDFRLSKTRSSDLFWEAIWPRLLAKGWHSEQPKDYSFSGSKNSLVFLIPGIKKFTKRRLVKGNHYFDSISDILNKVALEPKLIELELGAVKEISLKEESWQDLTSEWDSDNVLNTKCHQRYLQNLKPSPASAGFLIVDTSLVHQGQAKMRDVRLLPSETTCASTHSRQSEKDASEVSEDNDDATDNRAGSNKSGDATSAIDDVQPILLKKCRYDLEMRAGLPDCEGSTTQQRDLSPLACGESNSCIGNLSAQSESYKNEFHFLSPVKNKSTVLQGGSSQDVAVACTFVKIGPDEHMSESCKDEFPSLDKKSFHALINSNLQQVSTNTGTREALIKTVVQSHDRTCPAKSSCPSPGSDQQIEQSNPSYDTPNIEQQYNSNGCRKSSRNRPLTRKALEAMECGFFKTKRKRKDEKASKDVAALIFPPQMPMIASVSPTLNDDLGHSVAHPRIKQGGAEKDHNGKGNVVG